MNYERAEAIYTAQKREYKEYHLSFTGETDGLEEIERFLRGLESDDEFHVGVRSRIEGNVLEVDLISRDPDHLGRVKLWLGGEIGDGLLRSAPNRIAGVETEPS